MPWVELAWLGQTEELEHAEALAWFGAHGAKDMKAANEAICHALNFGKSLYTIRNPVEPNEVKTSETPRI